MRILNSIQREAISDPVRSKIAMAVPILRATLHSLKRDRIERLGGLERITLVDLAREFRQGDGDIGICFEYAVHEAILNDDPLIGPLASEVLESFCNIRGGASSILFGPEKEGVIPILETVQDSLTDDSIVHVGNRGRPPKLKRYVPRIINAFRRHEARNKLPRSISGIWKADLFLGNQESEMWVGTTIKSNAAHLESARGLRIGIYPKRNAADDPRLDEELNLIRLPLPYDKDFMELFYKAFNLTRAFFRADARIPRPVELPDSEDRFVAQELEARRDFPLTDSLNALSSMGQVNLIQVLDPVDVEIDATLSMDGLDSEPIQIKAPELLSLTPRPFINQ